MKILFINSVLGFGSTGKIVVEQAKQYDGQGNEVKVAYGRDIKNSFTEEVKKYGIRIGNDLGVCWHGVYSRFTDKQGLASKHATKRFIEWAEDYDPDILWLHNIHGYYINYELLFDWIKSRPQMKVKWTLHDCWAFTGHCSHFTYIHCDKWKMARLDAGSNGNHGCHNCPQLDQYPKAIADNSKDNYRRKKDAFTGVKDLTIITPSNWLKEQVQQSFLAEYPVEVVYNKIDTTVFKPVPSDFKEVYGIQDKKMILGVSSVWHERKGLNDFKNLAGLIDDKKYAIVMVGITEKQRKDLPKNIISIPRTQNVDELVKIYSAADLFVNPSYEETFGLTTIEAISCGTKAIVYSGSASDEIAKEYGGIIIHPGADNILKAINREFMENSDK